MKNCINRIRHSSGRLRRILALVIAAVVFSASSVNVFAYENGTFTIKTHESDQQVITPRVTYHFLGKGADTEQPGISVSEYYYFQNDVQDTVCKQILQNGEKLVEPPVPAPIIDDDQTTIRYRFYGWYVVKPVSVGENEVTYEWPSEDSRFDFSQPVSFTQDGDVYLAALYQNSRFLVFHEDTLDGSNHEGIVCRKIAALTVRKKDSNALTNISSIKAPLQNSRNEYFYGWSFFDENGELHTIPFYDESGVELDEVTMRVTGAMFEAQTVTYENRPYSVNSEDTLDLYPIYVNAHWLNFDTAKPGGGAKYAASKFVTRQTLIDHLDVSEMRGYTFLGWYDDHDRMVADQQGNLVDNISFQGGSVSGGRLFLSSDTTLHAKWQADSTSSYKVVYWFENGNDNGYTYAYHVIRTNRTAETMTNETAPAIPSVTPPDGANPEGFHLYGSNLSAYPEENNPRLTLSGQQKMISNDGSTVVNIYYNRNVVTLTFRENNRVVHTITGKYGLKIREEFERAPLGTTYQDRKWTDTNGSVYHKNYPFKTLEELPYKSVSLTSAKSELKGYIYYYTELLPGQTSNIVFDGRYFALHKQVEHNFNFLTFQEDFHPIVGFSVSKAHASPAFGSNDRATANYPYNYYLYYYREAYNMRFMFHDGDTDDLVIRQISFEDDISKYTANASALARYVPDQYEQDINNTRMVFKGWYDNSALEGEPVDLTNGKMPSHDVTLHAKWEKKYYIVKIDTNGGVLSQGDSTWFYREHGSTFDRYTVTRDYIAAEGSHTGTAYYRVDEQYDPAYDSYSDGYQGGSPTYRRRAAYITEDQFPDYEDRFIDKTTVYHYERNAFSLMGWYVVDENGNINPEHPYNFSEPVTGDLTIRALWRRSGLYYLHYNAVGVAKDEDGVEHTITGYLDDALTMTALDDPDEEAKSIGKGYDDKAGITLYAAPEGFENTDGKEWVFEGWQVMNEGQPLTVLLSPGDEQVISSEWSSENIITLQAVYAVRDKSVHIPKTVDLILDANESAAVIPSEVEADNEYIGTYTSSDLPSAWGSWKEPLTQGVWFDKQYNNGEFRLSDYADKYAQNGKPVFSRHDNFLLLGWDEKKEPLELSGGAYLPRYAADGIIGVHKEQEEPHTVPDILYAVWEPMVYLTFVNETDKPLSFRLDDLNTDAMSVINLVEGKYDRRAFLPGENNSVTLAGNQTLTLVLPEGEGSPFHIHGNAGQLDPGKSLILRTYDVSSDLEAEQTFRFDAAFSGGSTLHYGKNGVRMVFSADDQWKLTLDNNYPGAPAPHVEYFSDPGVSYHLPQPERNGYFFAGWSDTAGGAKKYGADTVAVSGLFPEPGQKQKTLYAVWKNRNTDVPVRYLLRENDGSLSEVTGNTYVISGSAKTTIENVNENFKSVAEELKDSYSSVQSYLTNYWNTYYRWNYTEVAYAIGNASASDSGTTADAFGLSHIVNNNSTGGAPNIRNSADGLQWHEGGSTWITCGDEKAVYVIFSKVTMVQVTVTCEITGDFAADDEITYTAVFGGNGSLGSGRAAETFTLKNGESYPITLSKASNANYQTVTITQTRLPQYTTAITASSSSATINTDALTCSVSSRGVSDSSTVMTVTYNNHQASVPVTDYNNTSSPFMILLLLGGILATGVLVLAHNKGGRKNSGQHEDVL